MVLADKQRTDDSTTDNDATNIQMHFLARLYHATHDKRVRESFCKAVEYLLAGQYDNGGWSVYSDKVLDPCPWGQRVYFYNCTREGGHGTWMNNNLSLADGAPEYHTVTAGWTFNHQWDPEKTIWELWKFSNFSDYNQDYDEIIFFRRKFAGKSSKN